MTQFCQIYFSLKFLKKLFFAQVFWRKIPEILDIKLFFGRKSRMKLFMQFWIKNLKNLKNPLYNYRQQILDILGKNS